MLGLNTRTDEYAFFDASVPFPCDSDLAAAWEKLEIVCRENDHLARLLPKTHDDVCNLGHVFRAYLLQQVLVVFGCAHETNKCVLALGGHDIPGTQQGLFMERLPEEFDKTEYPPSFYAKVFSVTDVIRKYIRSVQKYLDVKSALLADAVRAHIQYVEAQY